MNVTGVEWRDPHEQQYAAGRRQRRNPKPVEPEEDDVIEIHSESGEEPANDVDVLE